MRAKREKQKKIKIIPIILVVLVITAIIAGMYIIKKTNYGNNTNEVISNTTINEINTRIMAYIYKNGKNEELTDGKTYESNLLIYGKGGQIESITYNGSEFQGTELKDDGTYVITMKPDDNTSNISTTIKIEQIKPILQIGDNELNRKNIVRKIDSVVKLKEEIAKDKFTKAELIACDKNGVENTEVEVVDITSEIKEDGYKLSKGRYKIKLLDGNNEEVLCTYPFIIK